MNLNGPLTYVIPTRHVSWKSDSDLDSTKPSLVVSMLQELMEQYRTAYGNEPNAVIVHKDNRRSLQAFVDMNGLPLKVHVFIDPKSYNVSPKHVYVAFLLPDGTRPTPASSPITDA